LKNGTSAKPKGTKTNARPRKKKTNKQQEKKIEKKIERKFPLRQLAYFFHLDWNIFDENFELTFEMVWLEVELNRVFAFE
jgi:hypothetical protein